MKTRNRLYTIVKESSIEDLVSSVTKMIASGWVVTGGVSAVTVEKSYSSPTGCGGGKISTTYYMQALVLI